MNRLSLRNNWLKLETLGEGPTILEVSIEYTSNEQKQNWKMSTCNRLDSGTLHTHAKSHDHKIVRAQKKVSKGRPNTPPKSSSVITGPQVQCEVVCDRSLNHMLFQ